MKTYLPQLKGDVEIRTYLRGMYMGKTELSNALLPNSRELILRALGGDSEYLIDSIALYNGETLLAQSPTTPSYPDSNTLKLTAIFSEDSFTGDFTRAVLQNEEYGEFSELIGFTLSKSEGEVLSIGWKLKSQ